MTTDRSIGRGHERRGYDSRGERSGQWTIRRWTFVVSTAISELKGAGQLSGRAFPSSPLNDLSIPTTSPSPLMPLLLHARSMRGG